MSDKLLPTGIAPQVLVRGGTTSGAHDKERAVLGRIAQIGRAHQDRQMHAARLGQYKVGDGLASARLQSLRLMDGANPKLVLYYMNADGTVEQECVAEYVHIGIDEAFIMVCPRCLERGEAHGRSQMKIMKSHRKFHLDLRKAGTLVQLRDPDGKPFFVRLAGTVTVDDIVACDSCGLYKVRIADSKVWRV